MSLQFVRANSDKVEFTGYVANLATDDFTAELFVKFSDFSNGWIIDNYYADTSSVTGGSWMLRIDSSNMKFEIRDSSHALISASYATSNLSTGTWYRISCVADKGSTLKIYVDAVEAVSVVDNGTRDVTPTQILRLGTAYFDNTDTYSDYFNGFISDVRLWSAARTQTQIEDNMDKRLAGDESNLLHYWKFDEGTGTSIEDLVGSDDGTITGADWVSDNPTFYQVSGTLYEKKSDASGSAEHYLIIDPSDGSVLKAGIAESDGSFVVGDNNDTTEYALIMPDKDGDYKPTCLPNYITGVEE